MLRYIEHTGPPDETLQEEVFHLYRTVFNSEPNEEARERLLHSRDLLIVLALNEEDAAIGFKVGYRQDPDTFYSWLVKVGLVYHRLFRV